MGGPGDFVTAKVDPPKDFPKTAASQEHEDSCWRCGRLRSLQSDPVVAWQLAVGLVVLAVLFAFGGIAGYETGWARLHKDHYTPKTNTYIAIIEEAIRVYPEQASKIPQGLVDLVAPTLPDGTITLDIKLGWFKRHSELVIHTDDLPLMVLKFLEKPDLDPYRSVIDEVAVKKRLVRVVMYKDTDPMGQCSGAIVMATLGISVAMALLGIASYMLLQIRKTDSSHRFLHFSHFVMHHGVLIGMFILAACSVHYGLLAYGTYDVTKESLFVEHGFIPWPSWAWICGMISAALWINVGIMSAKGLLPDPSCTLCKSSRMKNETKNIAMEA